MIVFVDTSAIYSVVDTADSHFETASDIFTQIMLSDISPITTNYVVVETISLIQNRLGMDAVHLLLAKIVPSLEIAWLNELEHALASELLLSRNEHRLSFVDCSSFIYCREHCLDNVFAVDKHFEREGFNLLTP